VGPHPGEAEHAPISAYAGDLVDGPGTSWEAAWIDLGGEG
jgi:hypothetical protein